jgi:hypothetical protein
MNEISSMERWRKMTEEAQKEYINDTAFLKRKREIGRQYTPDIRIFMSYLKTQ